MTEAGSDKRRHIRVPVDFDVKFTFENHEHLGRALNLSSDGLFLKTNYMLLQNDQIEMYFQPPGIAKPIWIKARVVWGTWVEGHASAISGMGVQFVDQLPEQKETLDRYLQTLLKSQS